MANQTTPFHGQARILLHRMQKKLLPNFPIKVGKMVLKDRGHAMVEVE